MNLLQESLMWSLEMILIVPSHLIHESTNLWPVKQKRSAHSIVAYV